MKILMKLMAIFMLASFCALPSARAEDLDKQGIYIELGGGLYAPFLGEKIATGDPTFGFRQLNTKPGGGFNIGSGYDFGPLSLGGRIFYAYMPQEASGAPLFPGAGTANFGALGADLFGMDVETKLFPMEFFDVSNASWQPYALLGLGWGVFNSDFDQGELVWSTNLGLGVQYLINEHWYVALEGSYRAVFNVDPCGFSGTFLGPTTFACDGAEHMQIIQAGLNIGFRF